MVYRKDNFKFNDYRVTPNGFIVVSGIVTRTGVFKYEDGNELRPDDEVLNKNSLSTIFALPVTWEHPNDLLTPESIPMFQKGIVASQPLVEKMDSDISVIRLDDIIIQDSFLITEVVENGLREFSLGYTCDLEEKEGKFDGQDYVRVQKNIIYNHLALVRDARCGNICSITTPKGDEMASKYKADCACQKSITRKDEMVEKKDPMKEEEKKDEDKKEVVKEELKKKEEDKKDESEEMEPSWTKKMFEQHGKMLEALEKLISMQKTEDKKDEMKDKDKDADADDDLYDGKDEGEMKKDKRKDSVKDTISSFKFDSQKRSDSETFKSYNRDEFLKTVLNKGAK